MSKQTPKEHRPHEWTESRKAALLERYATASLGLLSNAKTIDDVSVRSAMLEATYRLRLLRREARLYRKATRKKKGKAHEANT